MAAKERSCARDDICARCVTSSMTHRNCRPRKQTMKALILFTVRPTHRGGVGVVMGGEGLEGQVGKGGQFFQGFFVEKQAV